MFKPISREEYHKILWKKWYIWLNECPFCPMSKKEDTTRIWSWKYWFIIYNIASYSWDHRHIMAIPHRHVIYSRDLNERECAELPIVHEQVKNFFWDEEYFSFTRETFGDWACRSVEHLHMHFLVGRLYGSYLRKMLQDEWYPIEENDLKFN